MSQLCYWVYIALEKQLASNSKTVTAGQYGKNPNILLASQKRRHSKTSHQNRTREGVVSCKMTIFEYHFRAFWAYMIFYFDIQTTRHGTVNLFAANPVCSELLF